MTNQHIHHNHLIITAIWKEENVTPFLAENNKYKKIDSQKVAEIERKSNELVKIKHATSTDTEDRIKQIKLFNDQEIDKRDKINKLMEEVFQAAEKNSPSPNGSGPNNPSSPSSNSNSPSQQQPSGNNPSSDNPTQKPNKQQPVFNPTVDATTITNAENIEQAQINAKEQINKLFRQSKVKSNDLDKKLWNYAESWEKYLLTIKDKAKIVEFVEKMKQAIINKFNAIHQIANQKKPNSGNKLPLPLLIFASVLIFLVGVVAFIVRKRKRRQKNRIK